MIRSSAEESKAARAKKQALREVLLTGDDSRQRSLRKRRLCIVIFA